MAKCTYCQNDKQIQWSDYAYRTTSSPAVKIGLCYECLIELGWEKEREGIFPKMIICNTCKNKFIPKKSTQVKCGPCWAKFFRERDKRQTEKVESVMQCQL